MTHTQSRRRGGTTLTVAAIAGAIIVLGGGAAIFLGPGQQSPDEGAGKDQFTVRRGTFDITVPSSGELSALKQVEIRNTYEYRAVITEIIDEGKTVKKGDTLFRLADEEIRNKIKDSQDSVNNANIALVNAQSDLDLKTSESESELAKADLAVRLAGLALESWKEGEKVSTLKELELGVETAQINCQRLVERFVDSARLLEQQFISRDEYKRDEIELKEAQATLEQAQLDLEIFKKYTVVQDEAQKSSDLEQARDERDRVASRFTVELDTARLEVDSKEFQLKNMRDRLVELETQGSYCAVTAPEDGWVVYASSLESGRSWRFNGQPMTVGSELSRNDLVIILPDTSQMIAAVKVNEALSGLIQPGQPATITSDALPDVVMHGEVVSIGVLAESGGWIDRNRRDYTVKVLITDGKDYGLKPSMRAKAEIYVGRVQDTLHVPVQAVFREGATSFVYLPQDGGYAQTPIEAGRASELFVEVLSGLEESQIVLLRQPGPSEIVKRIQQRHGDKAEPTAPVPLPEQTASSIAPPRGPRPAGGPMGPGRERRGG